LQNWEEIQANFSMPHNPPRNTRDGAAELWVKLWSFALFPRRSLVFSAKQIPLGEIFTLRAAAGNSEKWFDCASTPTKRASGKLQNHRRKPALETAINILAQFPTTGLMENDLNPSMIPK